MLIAPEALVAIVVVVVIVVLASFARLRTGSRPPTLLDLRTKGASNENAERAAGRDVSPSSLKGADARKSESTARARDPERVALARRAALAELEREERERRSIATSGLIASAARKKYVDDEPTDPGTGSSEEKSLNAFFNFNGHTFDAYESLGLPAGSSVEAARAAFERAAAASERESIRFLEEALRAIERRR